MLDHDDAKYAQLRLSCQVKVTEELDGLVVEVTAL
jgi:ferredoxin